ncbi:MAG: PilT protein domain-containing protein [Chitinophagaceae bacterium]|nr:MAG: PilT protein domain-containing [Chitinophagaceae bacterium]TXT29838.1 MAG: PilT protein domain-containing protein [Chitinophagaceae bacterium]
MSGSDILVDTNIILYVLRGNDTLADFLNKKTIYIYFITELELLGFKMISPIEEVQINNLLSNCFVINLTTSLKNNYIKTRRQYNLKLADSLIAATSIDYGIPLITADKAFMQIKEIDLVAYFTNSNETDT